MPTPKMNYADPVYSKAYAEGMKANGSEANPYKKSNLISHGGWADGRYDAWSKKVTEISRVSVFYSGSVYFEPADAVS